MAGNNYLKFWPKSFLTKGGWSLAHRRLREVNGEFKASMDNITNPNIKNKSKTTKGAEINSGRIQKLKVMSLSQDPTFTLIPNVGFLWQMRCLSRHLAPELGYVLSVLVCSLTKGTWMVPNEIISTRKNM